MGKTEGIEGLILYTGTRADLESKLRERDERIAQLEAALRQINSVSSDPKSLDALDIVLVLGNISETCEAVLNYKELPQPQKGYEPAAENFECCPDCDGLGETCTECSLNPDHCECDPPKMETCQSCYGDGEIEAEN